MANKTVCNGYSLGIHPRANHAIIDSLVELHWKIPNAKKVHFWKLQYMDIQNLSELESKQK